jgi:serine phosphatase RsbU (regulator of sigma subunit)
MKRKQFPPLVIVLTAAVIFWGAVIAVSAAGATAAAGSEDTRDNIKKLEEKLLPAQGNEKIDLLNEISAEYYNIGDNKQAEAYARKALESAEKTGHFKGKHKALMNIADVMYRFEEYEKSISFYEQSLSIIEHSLREKNGTDLTDDKAHCLKQLGMNYYSRDDAENALHYISLALELYQRLGKKHDIADSLDKIGFIQVQFGNYEKAIDVYLQALTLVETLGDKIETCNILNSIGDAYRCIGNKKKALEYLDKSIKICRETGADDLLADALNSTAIIHEKSGNYETALKNFNEALAIYREIDYQYGAAGVLNNIGEVFRLTGRFNRAQEHYLEALKVFKEIGNEFGAAYCLNNIGMIHAESKQYKKAAGYFDQSLKLAEQHNIKDLIKEIYENYAATYEATGKFKKALTYHKLYSQTKDTLFSEDSSRQIAEMQAKYETEKKEKEIQILTRDKEIKELDLEKQKLLKKILIAGFALVFIFVGLLYNRYRIKTKAHNQLTKAHHSLDEANRRIEASIKYAERIQKVTLPLREKLTGAFRDCFVIYIPKDIVSGDFYWFSTLDRGLFIAAVDCTGHGVPGAFMSMIGDTHLKQIVNETKDPDPALILENLHENVRKTLKQDSEHGGTMDGMDICLCTLDKVTGKLVFAGAKRPLYLVRHSGATEQPMELMEFKGDRKSIGGRQKELKRRFKKQEIDAGPGDMIYLTTDGFVDQQNNNEERFGSERLKNLLLSIARLKAEEQEERLLAELYLHKGDEEQQDDITVIGIRL